MQKIILLYKMIQDIKSCFKKIKIKFVFKTRKISARVVWK